jgi:hypothetical protein
VEEISWENTHLEDEVFDENNTKMRLSELGYGDER